MELLYGAIIGVVIYSLLGTIAALITREDEETMYYFAIGICGIVTVCILRIPLKIKEWRKYKDKRSIIYIENTDEKKWCRLKDANDIYLWHKGYRLQKRYADKSEWKELNTFSEDFIIWSKQHCKNCQHNEICFNGDDWYEWENPNVKCSRDDDNPPCEYDKFEPKIKRKWVLWHDKSNN